MSMTLAPEPTRVVKTSLPPETNGDSGEPLATFLGLFSIGLGLAEVLRPRRMAKRTGVPYQGLVWGYGVREIACGVGILSSRRPAGWLWARVAGDVLDLATLAAAYAEARSRVRRRRALEAAAAVAGVTVLDILCAQEHSRDSN
jgi:hypothetical protein